MEHQNDHPGGYSAPKPRKKKRRGLRLIAVLCAIVVLLAALLAGMLLHIQAEEQKLESRAARVHAVQESTPETIPETIPEALPESTQAPAEAFTAPPEQIRIAPDASGEAQSRTVLAKYADCYAENPDMFGWVRIDGTMLDYPVMHTPEEPEKYLHTSFEGTASYPGVPFLDAACSATSDNLIIYGHNMPSGAMFRALMNYQQKTYWQEHPIIHFDTLYEEQEFEVLAAFYDRVYTKWENVFKFYQFIDAKDAADYDNAISQLRSKSLYDTGVEAHYGDQLITLVTCAYHTENGRFVVVARKK